MFSSALKVLALAAVALALPATESTNATAVGEVGAAVEVPEAALDATARILTICNGVYPYSWCINLPTNNGVCINIPTSHAPQIGGGRIPPATSCTFYSSLNCPSTPRRDMVTLNAGTYDLTQWVPNVEGNLVAFSPRRSYRCTWLA